jgi:hypothetical protein
MKLSKLTKQQQQKLEEIKNKWVNHYLDSGYETSYAKLRPMIDKIYEKIGLQKPFIFISDGYYSQKLMINYVIKYMKMVCDENQVGNQVENQVRNQVRNQVWNQVRNQVWNQVWNQVENQVENQVRNQVGNQVRNQVRNQVGNQVGNQGLVFFEQYFGSWNCGWLSFFDYFEEIGIIDDKEFKEYKTLQMEGFSLVFFEFFVVVCKLPIKCLRDDNNRLHSIKEPSVQWRDNYNQYFIHGVPFDEESWKKVSERQLSPKQVMQIKNTEQRRVAINHYGWDVIFDFFEKKLIDKSPRLTSLAELYSVKGLADNIKINIVRYKDPSTERWYVSQVPDEDDYGNEIKTADHAMAWKSWLTLEEYQELKIEG